MATHCLSPQNWSFNLAWHLPASVWLSVIRPQCLIVCWSTVDYDYNLSSPQFNCHQPSQRGNSRWQYHPQLSAQLQFFSWMDGCIPFMEPIPTKQLVLILQNELFLCLSIWDKNLDFQMQDSAVPKAPTGIVSGQGEVRSHITLATHWGDTDVNYQG